MWYMLKSQLTNTNNVLWFLHGCWLLEYHMPMALSYNGMVGWSSWHPPNQHMLELWSGILVSEWHHEQVSWQLNHSHMLSLIPITMQVQCWILGGYKLEFLSPFGNWTDNPSSKLVWCELRGMSSW